MDSSVEAHLERAFGLAYFFHPDRDLALGIAARALTKLRVAERVQVRRAYYQPSGRRHGGGLSLRSRTKVSVERAQLLQRLVLLECESIELEQESRPGAAALSDDEFALRFVKHLVRIGARRNSLYVAVAIGRILHCYGTAEVLELLANVIQDPERVPEDSYLRHVKRNLFLELRERFGGLLRLRTGARGEESFEAAAPTPSQRRLINQCLELLTPWDTECPVPSGFDAMSQTLTSLGFAGTDPDDEHATEVQRMHSLIHPDCFLRLTAGLRLESPVERLTIPRPFRSSDTGGDAGSGGDRTRPPRLVKDDLEELHALWSREDKARRTLPITRLSVRVDGVECVTLELRAGAAAACDIEEGAELVEVWGAGVASERPVLLAVHLLRLEPLLDDQATRQELAIDLGRGREVLLLLTSRSGAASSPRIQLEARCTAGPVFSRLRERGLALLRWPRLREAPGGWWATVAALLLVVGAVLLVGIWRQPSGGGPGTSRAPIDRSPTGERTRGASATGRSTTLETARRVYLGSPEGSDATRVVGLLHDALIASGRFEPTTDDEAADSALKAELAVEEPALGTAQERGVRLELRLVDEEGRTLWSTAQSGPSWEAVVERAIGDLVQQSGRTNSNQGERQ